jgi:hypothetical protein
LSTIKAVVRNGRIETGEPLDLPDGTELLIPIPDRAGDEEPGWDNSPEGIAAWLAWSESLEPLIFTEEEKAAWEADRRARKEWEAEHFDEYTDSLTRMWP